MPSIEISSMRSSSAEAGVEVADDSMTPWSAVMSSADVTEGVTVGVTVLSMRQAYNCPGRRGLPFSSMVRPPGGPGEMGIS